MNRRTKSGMATAARYLLASHGEILVRRETAADAAGEIQDRFRPHVALLLSFAGVRVASLPFVDELLVRLHDGLTEAPEAILVGHGFNRTVREHVTTVLKGRGLVLPVVTRRGVGLLGANPELRRVMRTVQEMELEFTAAQVAEKLPHRHQIEDQIGVLISSGAIGGRGHYDLRRPKAEHLLELAP